MTLDPVVRDAWGVPAAHIVFEWKANDIAIAAAARSAAIEMVEAAGGPFARARRTRREIAAVLGGLAGHTPPALPAVFELTRTGWNSLDPDGLVAALKAPIDALAQWTGADDRDWRLFWRLAQSVTREVRLRGLEVVEKELGIKRK